MATTKITPTLDGSGRLRDKNLPTRLAPAALAAGFEARVSRAGATTGQVVTLLSSGLLGLTTPPAGGSGGGGITATDNGDGTAALDAASGSSTTITDNNDGTAVL